MRPLPSDSARVDAPAIEEALQRLLGRSGPFKRRLERFLTELAPAHADEAMMLMKESRGAWALLLAHARGRALFVGNAMSGTPTALGTLGFDVVVVDDAHGRLRFALERGAALVPDATRAVRAGHDARLPFVDDSFDVVVLEGGLPSRATGWGFGVEELRRVARDEFVVTSDNRFGYKRSTGRRGEFRRSPRILLREIVRPSRGEMALRATRRVVLGDWRRAEAYSLYPHAREFSHVVALDADHPRLTIGRRERRNRLKMVGFRLGLFPHLTPSFAIHVRRGPGGPSRLDRLLDRIARETGEPRPVADVFVATRSNDALVQTVVRGQDGDAGRWTIHVALQPAKRRMVRIHHDWLGEIRRRFPGVPAPEPLFLGDVEGADVAVERRAGGWNGTDLTGERTWTASMFQHATEVLIQLLEPRPTSLDDELYGRLVEARFERVIDLIASADTKRSARRMARRFRDRALGASLRLGVYHADLRGKHLQIDGDGQILGVLDWGASEPRFLPLVDLLHLVIHQRKQEEGGTFGDAWRAVRDPRTRRDHEDHAIQAYVGAASLSRDLAAAILEAYPLFVAGMAERNWDYSRPDWVARQFEIAQGP